MVLAWGLLVELNFAVGAFSEYDKRFARGSGKATKFDVGRLVLYISKNIKLSGRLSKCALSFGIDPGLFDLRLETLLSRMHTERLKNSDYAWLNDLTDSLLGGILVFYLPNYRRANLPTTKELLDQCANEEYGLSYDDLRTIKYLVNLRIAKGRNFIGRLEDAPTWKLFDKFILEPDRLVESTIDQLVARQPTLFLNHQGEFRLHYFARPLLVVRCLALERIRGFERRYTNIEGDSLELFLQDYLGRITARFIPEVVDFETKSLKQFGVLSHVIVRRKDVPELFNLLPDPEKPELEVDLVANHDTGYSIIFESKFCSHPGRARKYYLTGIGESMAVQKRLRAIVSFLFENPKYRKLFGIPAGNRILGAFVTNQHGPYFNSDDGILKVSVWEVYLRGHLDAIVEKLPKSS